MKNQYLLDWFGRLDATLAKAKAASQSDPELGAYFAGYLVVLISGAFEDCFRQLFNERTSKANDAEVENFVRSTLDITFRNPKYERIRKHAESFSQHYATELDKRIDTNARDAIGSIISNRHLVAHGRSFNATLGDIENYYLRSKIIFEELEDILK